MNEVRAPLIEMVEGAVFRGYRPEEPLAQAVELIWTVRGRPSQPQDRVLPNGVIELIINLGPPQRVLHGPDRFTRYHRALVAGLQRRPLDIASEQDSRLVGIRFRPGGASAVLGMPVRAVTDQVIEIEGRGSQARLVRELRERLLDARDDGVGPKMLGRILRFQRVLAALGRPGPVDWADLAYASGYADQAHLCGEFRALAGIVPTAYHQRRTVDPNHLSLPAPAGAPGG